MQRISRKQRVTRGRRGLLSILVLATVVASLTPFAGRAAAANGSANLYLGKTVSAATLTPALSLTLRVNNSNANVSSYSYDPATGLQTTASDPDGPIQTVTYGSDGRVASIANGGEPAATVTTAPGAEQQVILDPNGRLSTVLTFDSLGDVLERDRAVNGQTLVTKYAYDAAGRLTDLFDPSGAHPRWTYDETSTASNGNVLTYSDASGHTWQFGNYDQHGNPGMILSPTGRRI